MWVGGPNKSREVALLSPFFSLVKAVSFFLHELALSVIVCVCVCVFSMFKHADTCE